MDIATAADLADLTAFHNDIEDLDAIAAEMDLEAEMSRLETELYYLEDIAEGADFMQACEHGL